MANKMQYFLELPDRMVREMQWEFLKFTFILVLFIFTLFLAFLFSYELFEQAQLSTYFS
tara:strand:- start:461 stop:637 length:177 start_codon:yes stop_codon:yes gene_type:complete